MFVLQAENGLRVEGQRKRPRIRYAAPGFSQVGVSGHNLGVASPRLASDFFKHPRLIAKVAQRRRRFQSLSALHVPPAIVSPFASSPVGIDAGLKVVVPKRPSFKGEIGTGK